MIRKTFNSPNVVFRYVSIKKIYSAVTVMQGLKTDKKFKVHKEENSQTRFNPIKIQMLSSGLHRQIFGDVQCYDIKPSVLKMVIEHLKKHKLWENEGTILPDTDLHLPRMYGSNISEHFEIIGTRLSSDYKMLLEKLVKCSLPPLPKKWKFSSGWTRYSFDGNVESVEFPEDSALVFDVEVCVEEGNYPTLAAAASHKHWYLWCSERLVQDQFSWSQGITLSDLIPLETSLGQIKPSAGRIWNPRLVIGHNVSFDRAFIKEQYFLQDTKMHFLDTMSLHICVSGLTGIQRAMSVAYKNISKTDGSEFSSSPMTWMDISSLNNLSDVYSLYCEGASLKKEQRDVFVSGTLADVREQFQNLATYCARDVQATHKVLQRVTPLFFERFPHPVTFAGMLEMSSAYLPVNQNWERYLRDAQDTYDDLEKELKLLLVHLANDACSLYHGSLYKNDPWLWDLDWSVQEIKFLKSSQQDPSKKKRRNLNTTKKEKLIIENEELKESNEEETICSESLVDPILNDMLKSAASLTKVRRFLPGYPMWYRELNTKNNKADNIDWEPGPSLISTQMRFVPKLMRLTWDGFPLHFDSKHGWGYLVPGKSHSECVKHQNFPLEHLLELYRKIDHQTNALSCDMNSAWDQIKQPRESKQEEDKCWKLILSKTNSKHVQKVLVTSDGSPYHYGNGPYDDVDIRGCWFYRLPHKDGPHKRVGNPLSKDFLAKVEDGTLKPWGKDQANRALLLSKTLSYWKNSRSRIISQMVVWLNKSELPRTVTRSSSFDEDNLYGAILPRLVVSGTVTRRAVEPTWLTASNAYVDRLGSELKSIIQSPPGYHFVGADVDSQELWIAALFGDSHFAGIHGCTAFGWMTLQGKKSTGTDMHSRTAALVGITRDQAKILNYGRIYGAGLPFSQRLLMQFNHRLTPEEAKCKIKKMYAETKGVRQRVNMYEDVEDQEVIICNPDSPELSKKIWVGGSESHMFNKLEEIAQSSEPRTPVLKCCISRALEPAAVDQNFMTSRVNWVVQSSAVDYLHLMLVCMKWLFDEFDIEGRFSISIHDEVRYLVKSEDRYRAALALQITNLLTRSFFAFKLGMKDLPQSVAFFSSVDVDSVLRKEVTMDCSTPSNPHGLEKGYGIPEGETLDIFQVMEKTNGGSLRKTFLRRS